MPNTGYKILAVVIVVLFIVGYMYVESMNNRRTSKTPFEKPTNFPINLIEQKISSIMVTTKLQTNLLEVER